MSFIILRNGVILAEPGQLDPMIALQPTKTVATKFDGGAQMLIDQLVERIAHIRKEWLADGVPLTEVEIPVQDMFEEFADLLESAGCRFNRKAIVGDAQNV